MLRKRRRLKAEALQIAVTGYWMDEDEAREAINGDPIFGELPGPAPEAPEEPDPIELIEATAKAKAGASAKQQRQRAAVGAMTPYYDHDGVRCITGIAPTLLPAAGVKANLILTSPPYGDNHVRTYGGHGFDSLKVVWRMLAYMLWSEGGVLVWQRIGGDATALTAAKLATMSFRQCLGNWRSAL